MMIVFLFCLWELKSKGSEEVRRYIASTSGSCWKKVVLEWNRDHSYFSLLHFALLETSWIKNKLKFLSFVRNEPGQGTVEPKQAETLRSVWKKTMCFLGGRDLSFLLPSNHIRWNATDLQQEMFSIWCKCSRRNPRGHTFSSVNCTYAIFSNTCNTTNTYKTTFCFCQLNVRFTKGGFWQKHW